MAMRDKKRIRQKLREGQLSIDKEKETPLLSAVVRFLFSCLQYPAAFTTIWAVIFRVFPMRISFKFAKFLISSIFLKQENFYRKMAKLADFSRILDQMFCVLRNESIWEFSFRFFSLEREYCKNCHFTLGGRQRGVCESFFILTWFRLSSISITNSNFQFLNILSCNF